MSTLLCFGLGYSAEHFVGMFGDGFGRIAGTVRGVERAALLNARFAGRLQALPFDGISPTPEVERAIAEADLALISIPQTETGDPVLAAFGDALLQARRLRSIVYLSTVGVYGDHGGAWVDEDTPPRPQSARGRGRLAAERAWQEFGARSGAAVTVLRLAGIYGSGRNALVQIARGDARRIAKPGQVFNRIHVGDIAQAIDAAFARKAAGIFNVSDDEPTSPGRPDRFRGATSRPRSAAGDRVRRRRTFAVADGFEFLAGMPPCTQRQAQARAWRCSPLSHLPRRSPRIVRSAMTLVMRRTLRPTPQCRLGPLRKRLRSPDLIRISMVWPSR